MSSLSQEQKTKVNNFLRSLNQRLTNFIEEMVAEEGGQDVQKRTERQVGELDQLLDELQNPPPVAPEQNRQSRSNRPRHKNRRRDDRRDEQPRQEQQFDQSQQRPVQQEQQLPVEQALPQSEQQPVPAEQSQSQVVVQDIAPQVEQAPSSSEPQVPKAPLVNPPTIEAFPPPPPIENPSQEYSSANSLLNRVLSR